MKISVRLSDELLNELNIKTKGTTFSERIRKAITAGLFNKPIDNVDYSDLIKQLQQQKNQISAIGNNLNQLVAMLNSGYILKPDEVKPILIDIKKVFTLAIKTTKKMQSDIIFKT